MQPDALGDAQILLDGGAEQRVGEGEPSPVPEEQHSGFDRGGDPVEHLLGGQMGDRSDEVEGRLAAVETHVRHILAKLGLPGDTGHNRRVLAVLTYLRETGNHEAGPH